MLPFGTLFTINIHGSLTIAKMYGVKLRFYWERVRKCIGTWGTFEEPDRKPLGT
jgi:hypothetical protein